VARQRGGRQGDRDRETERQRDRETGKDKDRDRESVQSLLNAVDSQQPTVWEQSERGL
jgi:hypothetical protein